MSDENTMDTFEQLRRDVTDGLLYTHHRANANTGKTLEVTSFAYALIELLIEKGLLTEEELNERKQKVMERLAEKFRENGMGVVRMEPEHDKYAFEDGVKIDCENRVHLCHAACCRLQFALSRQDVEEGIVKWDFSRPYMIRQSAEGYCIHLERNACRCSVYDNRPVPCRAYDCRNDKRIWADFERKIPNPDLEKVFGRDEG
jgi:Fe-S-cluster containining protein